MAKEYEYNGVKQGMRRIFIRDAMEYARQDAYKNIYIPKSLRDKIEVVIKDGDIIIKLK
jgi:hypothetical protein